MIPELQSLANKLVQLIAIKAICLIFGFACELETGKHLKSSVFLVNG